MSARRDRDPVVIAVSQALADVFNRRGGRWVPEPQWRDEIRGTGDGKSPADGAIGEDGSS